MTIPQTAPPAASVAFRKLHGRQWKRMPSIRKTKLMLFKLMNLDTPTVEMDHTIQIISPMKMVMFQPGHQFIQRDAVLLSLGISGGSYNLILSANFGEILNVFSGRGCIPATRKAMTNRMITNRMRLNGVNIVSAVEMVVSRIFDLIKKLPGVLTSRGADAERPECHVQPNPR